MTIYHSWTNTKLIRDLRLSLFSKIMIYLGILFKFLMLLKLLIIKEYVCVVRNHFKARIMQCPNLIKNVPIVLRCLLPLISIEVMRV